MPERPWSFIPVDEIPPPSTQEEADRDICHDLEWEWVDYTVGWRSRIFSPKESEEIKFLIEQFMNEEEGEPDA